jgi:hypothetical protein
MLLGVLLYWRPFQRNHQAASRPVSVSDAELSEELKTLGDAIAFARAKLVAMDSDLNDYRGRIVKQERIDGVLGEQQEMAFKIRTRRASLEPGGVPQPFSVYLKFLQPTSLAGREVVWVENANEGQMTVHESGFAGLVRLQLDPTGFLAMRGNLHPIHEIGFQNLVEQLIQRAQVIEAHGGADVRVIEGYPVGESTCQLIQVRPRANSNNRALASDAAALKAEGVDFYLAEIAIDSQRGIPLRYAAYGVPNAEQHDDPPLLEEYTYLDVELNIGLDDFDFNPDNPEYEFP